MQCFLRIKVVATVLGTRNHECPFSGCRKKKTVALTGRHTVLVEPTAGSPVLAYIEDFCFSSCARERA